MFKTGLENIEEPYRSLIKDLLNTLFLIFKDDLVSLIVYGSVARGQMRKDSDVDLLIIVENLPTSRFERIAMFNRAEELVEKSLNELLKKGYYVTFSPIIKTTEEAKKISPLYLDMVDECIIVYDKNSFFKKILERLSIKLMELGAERVWVGRKWYWRLKRDYKFGEVIVIE
ncbi:MAG: nucleotidyltransferase domain-containing protein [Nitrososphaeria archaeon]|nr:nucleotidyltransferase domain-containing protein [Nitrososphaeria archaeon]